MDELKSILGENLARLSDVEQCVIRARFAIDNDVSEQDVTKGKTLEQVGEMIGVTKERVRQIQNKALGKLKTVLEQGVLAVLAADRRTAGRSCGQRLGGRSPARRR